MDTAARQETGAGSPAASTHVAGFVHLPGHHCGSTALRNLLAFHGTEISEELALGLGAGPCFYYLTFPELSPTRFTNGRSGRLEEDFLELTGAPLRLRTDADPERSWELAREAVDEGRPILLITDLFHLDHYGNSAHFPGHAVVLAGYDDDFAYLSDTAFEGLQRTSLEGLARARHEQHPLYPLAGHMVDVPGLAPSREELLAAGPAAIARAARVMQDPPDPRAQGLPALRRLRDEIADWPADAPDWQWCARFNYQVIERRGTGGSNFRSMYARFLAEVGRGAEAELATAAAERWSGLATELYAASEAEDADPADWKRIAAVTAEVLEAEELLWAALASA